MITPDSDCAHSWSRSLSDLGTPACRDCGAPYDPDTHDPAVAEGEPPVRSVDGWAIILYEAGIPADATRRG